MTWNNLCRFTAPNLGNIRVSIEWLIYFLWVEGGGSISGHSPITLWTVLQKYRQTMIHPYILDILTTQKYFYHHLGCTSIFWPLSYPFRSLVLTKLSLWRKSCSNWYHVLQIYNNSIISQGIWYTFQWWYTKKRL